MRISIRLGYQQHHSLLVVTIHKTYWCYLAAPYSLVVGYLVELHVAISTVDGIWNGGYQPRRRKTTLSSKKTVSMKKNPVDVLDNPHIDIIEHGNILKVTLMAKSLDGTLLIQSELQLVLYILHAFLFDFTVTNF